MRSLGWSLLCVLSFLTVVTAQDTGASLVTAARKRVDEARGKVGPERDAILEDGLRLLAMVPERFPSEQRSVARSWLESGRLQKRLARLDLAILAFNKVLEHPKETRICVDALHDLASVHRQRRERDPARAALERIRTEFAMEKRAVAEASLRKGALEREAGRLDVARTDFESVINDHPDLWRPCVDALDSLVLTVLAQKDPKAARELLTRHEAALRARFANTEQEERVGRALEGLRCRSRLDQEGADVPNVR